MSKHQKQNNPHRPTRKLTRTEKKEIKAAIARANRSDKKGISAQETIPYKRMFPDGICRVTGKLIPKERLRLVPHATLTVEAKEMLARQGKN